mmetsp:Transcript_23835/g.74506  ORF Transcript_23835/g.74506 Transcript_23835/m.74506 type:complete len:317 (-) Transcript_23835:501-1451(-)
MRGICPRAASLTNIARARPCGPVPPSTPPPPTVNSAGDVRTGGSCLGSPTASRRSQPCERGTSERGSIIWEHSSSSTILNLAPWRLAPPAAQHVAPTTRAVPSLLDRSARRPRLAASSSACTRAFSPGLLHSLSICSSSATAADLAVELLSWTEKRSTGLAMRRREPTRTKSSKPLSARPMSTRSTATLVQAEIRMRVSLSPAASRARASVAAIATSMWDFPEPKGPWQRTMGSSAARPVRPLPVSSPTQRTHRAMTHAWCSFRSSSPEGGQGSAGGGLSPAGRRSRGRSGQRPSSMALRLCRLSISPDPLKPRIA